MYPILMKYPISHIQIYSILESPLLQIEYGVDSIYTKTETVSYNVLIEYRISCVTDKKSI